jgi:hypothetical protein
MINFVSFRIVEYAAIVVREPLVLDCHLDGTITTPFVTVVTNSATKDCVAPSVGKLTERSINRKGECHGQADHVKK